MPAPAANDPAAPAPEGEPGPTARAPEPSRFRGVLARVLLVQAAALALLAWLQLAFTP